MSNWLNQCWPSFDVVPTKASPSLELLSVTGSNVPHDDVIKWKHFSVLLAPCERNSPVSGEFSSQRPVTRSFDIFFELRLNKQLNNRDAGDLRRHHAHYDVIVMFPLEQSFQNVWDRSRFILVMANEKPALLVQKLLSTYTLSISISFNIFLAIKHHYYQLSMYFVSLSPSMLCILKLYTSMNN